MSGSTQEYYVPHQSHWPFLGSVGLFLLMLGLAFTFQEAAWAPYCVGAGLLLIAMMLVGWFRHLIAEGQAGLYSQQVEQSLRLGMFWFIFSEVMFFASLFGALFYIKLFALPWLAGEGARGSTQLLWPHFQYQWPLLQTPAPQLFPGAHAAVSWWWLPGVNTIILLGSSVLLTWAHRCLVENARQRAAVLLGATLLAGCLFLGLQAYEYRHAYTELHLSMHAGIYWTLFYVLTGFHGLHVAIGSIMLGTIWLRLRRGHFSSEQHFAFAAVAWYWHFVDVVWLLLFIVMYIWV
jgi:cytochrome c oxidase subunit 3